MTRSYQGRYKKNYKLIYFFHNYIEFKLKNILLRKLYESQKKFKRFFKKMKEIKKISIRIFKNFLKS